MRDDHLGFVAISVNGVGMAQGEIVALRANMKAGRQGSGTRRQESAKKLSFVGP